MLKEKLISKAADPVWNYGQNYSYQVYLTRKEIKNPLVSIHSRNIFLFYWGITDKYNCIHLKCMTYLFDIHMQYGIMPSQDN